MSRRRKAVDYEHVAVDVVCNRGHRVGVVSKTVPPDPRPGRYRTGGGIRFEDLPENPGPGSGRVRGTCPECGDDVQLAWIRVRGRLDENAAVGQHTDEMRP